MGGKTQMVCMDKVKQYETVFTEDHYDSEVFKTRLGKALNHVGQLFAREAPERELIFASPFTIIDKIEDTSQMEKIRQFYHK
ncbi:hypothetical protein Glove_106g19 [Diversispora epigaea]|uniref:Uncharacterized protein n=1 Tax=Diversispora epigaea TaxID=1348612 RepID=A0A397J7D5_9GLOM|nr:hypothetical protein Glove_106g19 [Diversispora epigaea]